MEVLTYKKKHCGSINGCQKPIICLVDTVGILTAIKKESRDLQEKAQRDEATFAKVLTLKVAYGCKNLELFG